ncbi:TonB-dependent receptor [Novosphingobium terrae]|uniref:TonB-dependent receptor n=1 Tax=Novosphingobium terrae TaxID=2726189 RepID=UPI001F13F1C0|nr:TonB-dependent receptor [Novosphingobium terrae]
MLVHRHANRLLRTSTALCLALCAMPAVAHAAAPAAAPAPAADADADQGLTDIVVTAEKRPESLQKTPISISVLKSDDLANRHVTSLLDLGDGAIPSLRVAPFFARPSALILNIRGIGVLADSNQPARDQGVGIYIDGVYMGRAQGLGTAMFDVDSIEVLKGPQGTLFGRNTEGGAVSITTKKPSGKFAMSTTVGAGNYGSYKAETHLDLPEFHNISVKVDGVIAHRDGLVKNPLAGASDFGAYDKRGLHAEALWKPAPNFSADYSYDTSRDSSTSAYVQAISAGSLARAPDQPLQPQRASVATVGVPELPSVGKTNGHRLTLDWEVQPHLTLKSISAYRELTQSQYDNGSANLSVYSPSGTFSRASLAQFRQNQLSQELQVIGETPRLKFAAGALFYEERVQDNAQAPNTMQWNATGTSATVLSIDYNAVTIDRASHVKTDSYGAYAQATYTPAVAGDILHVTGGLRYSNDKKVGQLFTINGATPVSVTGVVAPLNLNASWSRVDPMINLAVDATRDIHLYGKWSTGYKSGGANSRSLTYAPFNPETVSMFEIGAKTEFWNHRARFNLAGYVGTYKNVQVDFSASYLQYVNGVLQNSNRTTLETTNAPGTGHLSGVEAEFTLNPLPGLTLNASYAYNHVTIPDTANPYPVVSGGVSVISTTPVKIYPVYTPTQSASGSLDYEMPLKGAKLRLHLDANYDNGFYVSANDPAPAIQPKGDPSFIMNGRLALADIAMAGSGARLAISAWARNLLNEQHIFYKAYSQYLGTYGMFNEARTYGLEANVKF